MKESGYSPFKIGYHRIDLIFSLFTLKTDLKILVKAGGGGPRFLINLSASGVILPGLLVKTVHMNDQKDNIKLLHVYSSVYCVMCKKQF